MCGNVLSGGLKFRVQGFFLRRSYAVLPWLPNDTHISEEQQKHSMVSLPEKALQNQEAYSSIRG